MDHWKEVQHNVVRYLRNTCRLADRFSEDEINHVLGVLEVNAFEITTTEGNTGRGLFPLTALMSHGSMIDSVLAAMVTRLTGCPPLSMWRSELPNSPTPEILNFCLVFVRSVSLRTQKPPQKFRISGVGELRS